MLLLKLPLAETAYTRISYAAAAAATGSYIKRSCLGIEFEQKYQNRTEADLESRGFRTDLKQTLSFTTMMTRQSLFCVSIVLLSVEPAVVRAQMLLAQGRVESAEQHGNLVALPAILSWAATTTTASFQNATSITISVEALPGGLDFDFNNFRVELDGTPIGDFATTPDEPNITWTYTDMSRTDHNLSLVKLTEAIYGRASLQNITLSQGGR
jgi:hypothetical protein